MYYKKGSTETEVRENMRGGGGRVIINPLCDDKGMPLNCRFAGEMVINKGCGIGEHVHENETEIYYCISGSGSVIDDGKEYPFNPGDSVTTGGGKAHSVKNENEEPLVIVGVIVTE